jgi:erythromycin esterase-like protein
MVLADGKSWNIRDFHMLDTLDALMRRHGPTAKGIVWAHNTHIGDYHATAMVQEGDINLGGIAREKWGIENIGIVGFGTHEGEVLAGRAWGARPEAMELPPAREDSLENYFMETSRELRENTFFLPLRDEAFDLRRGHRAVGVVYQPGYETHGRNYVPTVLSKRYDYFVFAARTEALRALPTAMRSGLLPETWPVGA